MDNFLRQLEAFKRSGYYAVNLSYGEGVGCDDCDVPVLERRIKLLANPVGCLGEARVAFFGEVSLFQQFDFGCIPERLNNPPSQEEIARMMGGIGGWFFWGTNDAIDALIKHWPDRQGQFSIAPTENDSAKTSKTDKGIRN